MAKAVQEPTKEKEAPKAVATIVDLLAEARGLSGGSFAGKHALMVPRLADALATTINDATQAKGEAASTEKVLRSQIAVLEAKLANVRERSITGNGKVMTCHMCGESFFNGGPESHSPDCPAQAA